MKKQFFSSQGFSILEILIAISLLSFITLGVISLTNDSINTRERISKEDKEKMQIVTALNVMDWDFSHLYSPLYYAKKLPLKGRITEEIYNRIQDRYERNPHFGFTDIEGRPVPTFENPDKNTFEFFTNSNRRRQANSQQSNFAWVKYTLESEPAKEQADDAASDPSGRFRLVRYFSAENPYKAEKLNASTDGNTVKAQVVLDNVEEIEFLFWNAENQKFVAPLTAAPGAVNMIRALQVKITWKDKLGGVQKIIKTYRPLWPVYDPTEEPDDLEIAQTTTPNPNQPGEQGASTQTEKENEEVE